MDELKQCHLEILDGSNYAIWKWQIEGLLKVKKLLLKYGFIKLEGCRDRIRTKPRVVPLISRRVSLKITTSPINPLSVGIMTN